MFTSPFVPATDRWGDRLPRRLGFWSAVAVLVGSTIGGGIFRTPAVIAERVPAPLPMFSVWVLGGLLALCGALLLLVLLAFFVGRGDWTHFTTAAGPLTPGLFGLALVSVLWAYDGWGDLSFVGGEVRDPERHLTRALVMGTAAIIAIYLLVNAAYLYLLPLGQMARSPLVAADAAQAVLGRIGVGAVTVVVMVATVTAPTPIRPSTACAA